jgi:hypothetical protein
VLQTGKVVVSVIRGVSLWELGPGLEQIGEARPPALAWKQVQTQRAQVHPQRAQCWIYHRPLQLRVQWPFQPECSSVHPEPVMRISTRQNAANHGCGQKANQNFAHEPIILRFYVNDCLIRFLYGRGEVIGDVPTQVVVRDIQSQAARHQQ